MALYKVSGMTCQGCVRALSNAFENEGLNAEVSLNEQGQVSVEVSAEKAKEIVENAGFDFDGLL